jgi:hypothetical protein
MVMGRGLAYYNLEIAASPDGSTEDPGLMIKHVQMLAEVRRRGNIH